MFYYFDFKRKKSKPHANFVRLSRLSTKMSIDESSYLIIDTSNSAQSTPPNKLNKFGQIIGNKLYNMVTQQASAVAFIAPQPGALEIPPKVDEDSVFNGGEPQLNDEQQNLPIKKPLSELVKANKAKADNYTSTKDKRFTQDD